MRMSFNIEPFEEYIEENREGKLQHMKSINGHQIRYNTTSENLKKYIKIHVKSFMLYFLCYNTA